MILPNNGKVVIIDDVRAQVQSLMDALTKEKMPFLFFQDAGGSDLPDAASGPIENVRLVFLDLDLGLGGNNPIEKIRILQSRIERIIKPNTPYALVIWSTHEGELKQTLIDEFDGAFNAYKPIAYCSLDKATILSGTNVVQTIRASLQTSLTSFESFNAFLLWESIINKSVGQVTNELLNIFEKNTTWDTNMKNMFYKIAFANLDSDSIALLNDTDKLKIAIKTINSSLVDSIENSIENEFTSLAISNVRVGGPGMSEDALMKLNTRMHLIKAPNLKHFSSGNLYVYDLSVADSDILAKTFKPTRLVQVAASNPKLLRLDITPSCDYAKRNQFTRILNGLLLNNIIVKGDFVGGEFLYKECPVMEMDSPSYMVFDFRYLQSFNKSQFDTAFTILPQYRLRSNLLLDIQAQLSNHINRPGIISVKR